jgi:hypothetical protein
LTSSSGNVGSFQWIPAGFYKCFLGNLGSVQLGLQLYSVKVSGTENLGSFRQGFQLDFVRSSGNLDSEDYCPSRNLDSPTVLLETLTVQRLVVRKK